MHLVVVYDISDDRARLRVADRLKCLGLVRVQRSAFVGRGGSGLARDVARATSRLIDHGRDSVIVFIVPDRSVRHAIVLGTPWGDLRDVPVRVL